MADDLLRLTARTIENLRTLAAALNDANHFGDAIRVYGFAGVLKELEYKLAEEGARHDSNSARGKLPHFNGAQVARSTLGTTAGTNRRDL